jgi:indole-3-glycerol phosphate synthase
MAAGHPPSATYLSGIVAAHRVTAAEDSRDPEELIEEAQATPGPRGFLDALSSGANQEKTSVIAEIKRRSPSKGPLALDLDPASLASAYEAGGASCLSVLTDAEFFGGSADDLRTAKAACGLPVLRKDFTVSANDIADARIMGADAILLIVSSLTDEELASFVRVSERLSLDALVEVHDEEELTRAVGCGARIIGINQRDLHTFAVDTGLACRLAALIPDGIAAVAESGITGPEDVARLAGSGFQAVLVGESLVTAPDAVGATRALTGHTTGPRRPARAMAGG